MLPLKHERFYPLQVVNLLRSEVVNFNRPKVVNLNRSEVVNFIGFSSGVVANFTSGTNNHYAESLSMRYLFVLFHLAQPSLLIWIFPSELVAILGVMLFTLACSIIVLRLNSPKNQRIVAVTLLLLSMILSALLNYTDPLAQLIMQFFSIKLILAFSVNWTAIINE
jgi:prepilin signal peptidase PulO-like enzyme (type II secretory pathway)